MPKMVIKLKSYLAGLTVEGHEAPSITALAKEIGLSRVQLQRIAGNKVESVRLDVLSNIIHVMRQRGFSMQTTDLIDYRED